MTFLSETEPAVSPVAIAGFLLAARTHLGELGLPHPSVAEILKATGARRSRAYEIRDRVSQSLAGLVRSPGRPRIEQDPPPEDRAATIRREILLFVMDHPGCVHGGPQRRRYDDGLRHRVLELRQEHSDLDLEVFAAAAGVPSGTVEDWLRPGTAGPERSDNSQLAPELESASARSDSDTAVAVAETILHAWREWRGDFTSFCSHVRKHHRIALGDSLISTILFAHGERTPHRRGRRHSDEDALRSTFETFFPGAQWVGDGTQITATVDGKRFDFNFELLVDAFSGAFVGTSIRNAEDAKAVVEAFQAGVETTRAAPLALLLDNRPSNHTAQVDEALDVNDTMRIRATRNRGQSKAHVEGGFGLFSQRAPDIDLRTDNLRELARQVIALLTTLFARVLNHRPPRNRNGKSRAQIYNETRVTEEQREQARRSLRERLRKQELARRTREARLNDIVKSLLDQAFERLDLLDPERHFRNAIACYPLDDIVDSIAIFESKRSRGKLPDGADARYLLGIVRNVYHQHESDAITQELIRARLDARDALLQPLVQQRDAILNDEHTNALRAFVDHALASTRSIDRNFWLEALADLIASKPDPDQRDLFRDAARRIHATFAVPLRQRSAAERFLARRLWPLS